jgi:hypothetical protein
MAQMPEMDYKCCQHIAKYHCHALQLDFSARTKPVLAGEAWAWRLFLVWYRRETGGLLA